MLEFDTYDNSNISLREAKLFFFYSLVKRIKKRHKQLEKYTSTIECVKRSVLKEETSRYNELPW